MPRTHRRRIWRALPVSFCQSAPGGIEGILEARRREGQRRRCRRVLRAKAAPMVRANARMGNAIRYIGSRFPWVVPPPRCLSVYNAEPANLSRRRSSPMARQKATGLAPPARHPSAKCASPEICLALSDPSFLVGPIRLGGPGLLRCARNDVVTPLRAPRRHCEARRAEAIKPPAQRFYDRISKMGMRARSDSIRTDRAQTCR